MRAPSEEPSDLFGRRPTNRQTIGLSYAGMSRGVIPITNQSCRQESLQHLCDDAADCAKVSQHVVVVNEEAVIIEQVWDDV